jgi:transitional endoplasmic reticulum ATPase
VPPATTLRGVGRNGEEAIVIDQIEQMEQPSETLRLQVAGSNERDVGKGVARLGRGAFTALGLSQGDVIEITGRRSTAAVALPAYPADDGLSVIRLDGLIRANAQSGMGEHVEVRPASVQPAESIVLAPAQKNMRLMGQGQALLRTLFGRPLVAGDVVSTSVYRRTSDMDPGAYPEEVFRRFFEQKAYGLQEIRLTVVSAKPRGIVRVTQETEIELRPQYTEPEDPRAAGVTYDDVGGLGQTIDQVREMIELPMRYPVLFQRLGIDPPKGVLLHGPPGTGKTLLARAVASECEAEFFHIAGPEIMGRFHGESEERLRKVFSDAQEQAPSIIFIDEIDSIAPKREEAKGETERRIVAQLLTLLDGLEPRQNVCVIGATNRPDALDEALRRPGRFDREIVVGVPDERGRRQVLGIHTRGMPLETNVELGELARLTYGFVGADLAALCREAAMEALRRKLPEIDMSKDEIPQAILEDLHVTRQDFQDALKRVQPSALREIMIQVPDIRWDDIGGMDDVKRDLREGVEMPLRSPDAFRKIGIRPAKGFLLFGPPGTGKTLIAKAVARESEANFLAMKSSDLLSKWYGESEKQISRLFKRARQVAPSIIFIDEIDALAPQRGGGIGEPAVTERVVNTMLAEMDGLEEMQGVVVIGATNRPTLLDPALLRPGRFDELIYVPLPDEKGRRRILSIHTVRMPLDEDVNLGELAVQTEGYTGADLENLVRRAGLHALRDNMGASIVSMRYFAMALEETRASVTREMEKEYRDMAEKLKQNSARAHSQMGFVVETTEYGN